MNPSCDASLHDVCYQGKEKSHVHMSSARFIWGPSVFCYNTCTRHFVCITRKDLEGDVPTMPVSKELLISNGLPHSGGRLDHGLLRRLSRSRFIPIFSYPERCFYLYIASILHGLLGPIFTWDTGSLQLPIPRLCCAPVLRALAISSNMGFNRGYHRAGSSHFVILSPVTLPYRMIAASLFLRPWFLLVAALVQLISFALPLRPAVLAAQEQQGP